MENLPFYINILFGAVTLLTVLFFYKAANYSKPVITLLILWLSAQGIISSTGFYAHFDSIPPRFMLLILPPLFLILTLFFFKKGRHFIDSLDIKTLNLLHVIRIPVEIVLFWLFVHKSVPQIMTFEGRNFDILSGITAPFIYYFGFIKNKLDKKIILAWNFLCLGLLINIVSIALLSAPFPFQQLAFNQPNIALAYFPFIWLPCCIVPLVLFSHLVSIRQLIMNRKIATQEWRPSSTISVKRAV
jgi:hypothetical protein